MLQCTDILGSGLGFKMSYPDDTLSLRRDSEKEGKTTAHGDVGVLAELAEAACDEHAGRLLCGRRGQRPGGGQKLTLKYSYFRDALCGECDDISADCSQASKSLLNNNL